MKSMVWYKNPWLVTSGIAVLALAAAQTVQIILFVALSTLMQQAGTSGTGWANGAVMVPAIVSALAGGAFLGRLRPLEHIRLWILTAVISGILPVLLQVVTYPESMEWLKSASVWLSMLGSALLWLAGCWFGSITQRRHPDSRLDRQLLQWTGGAVGIVVLLYAMTWGSIIFSKGYRMAKQVTLSLPPDVEEIDVPYREPGVAASRGFKANIPAGSTEIQAYYLQHMETTRWTDVSRQFQNWEPGNWQIRRETWDDETIEYRLDGAHWLDVSGKVAVTLILQAVRADSAADWQTGLWEVQGLILSRPYAEPRTSPEENESPDSQQDTATTPEDQGP